MSNGKLIVEKQKFPPNLTIAIARTEKLKRGLLIIDRGSREREASEELETICAGIKAKGDYVFTDYCFLEVEPPYIEDGISNASKKILIL